MKILNKTRDCTVLPFSKVHSVGSKNISEKKKLKLAHLVFEQLTLRVSPKVLVFVSLTYFLIVQQPLSKRRDCPKSNYNKVIS